MGGYQNMQVAGHDRLKEQPNDFYQTPNEVVENAFRILEEISGKTYHTSNILDVGAGTGVWGQTARTRLGKDARIDGVEIDPAMQDTTQSYTNWINQDLRDKITTGILYDLIMGNPPYGVTNGKTDRKLVEKIVANSYEKLHDDGWMMMLLKLPFLEGVTRMQKLFKLNLRPKYVFVSAARISWRKATHGKKTNTVSYALFYWHKNLVVDNTQLGWFNWHTNEYYY